MDIALTRVDSRLVHGQVIESWVPALKATMLLVADDLVARDTWRASIMKACVPDGLRVEVTRVEELNALIERGASSCERALVLFSCVSDAIRAYDLGFFFEQLNLGNVHEHKNSRRISSTVYLSPDDLNGLRRLHEKGVLIEIRALSRDKPLRSADFLDRIEAGD